MRLIAGQFMVPYRKSGKNDVNDAKSICEAIGRPNMYFVPIKSEEQQVVLMVHRARRLMGKYRMAQMNQIRGLVAEFGIVVPQGLRNSAVNSIATLPLWFRVFQSPAAPPPETCTMVASSHTF